MVGGHSVRLANEAPQVVAPVVVHSLSEVGGGNVQIRRDRVANKSCCYEGFNKGQARHYGAKLEIQR